jgi:hypothetical protein
LGAQHWSFIKIEGKEYVFCERRYRQVGFFIPIKAGIDKRDRLFYGSALLILVRMAYSFVGKSILDQNIRQALKNVEETSLILIQAWQVGCFSLLEFL